ncbi:hypothetical protein [Pyrococcus kukulkanii]|uniref:Uncharacterized protein n=1 Tax=Pyrococcus kukulkanii TaxID=1609559 RepID=A0ABV4T5X3_9EURY
MEEAILEKAIEVGKALGKYVRAKENDDLVEYLLGVQNKYHLLDALAHVSRAVYLLKEGTVPGPKPLDREVKAIIELTNTLTENDYSYAEIRGIAGAIATVAYATATLNSEDNNGGDSQ